MSFSNWEGMPLREVNTNVVILRGGSCPLRCELPLPKVARKTAWQLQEERVEVRLRDESPLTFADLHREVRSILELDFDSMEGYERLRRRGVSSELPDRFEALLRRADESAQCLIQPLRDSWYAAGSALSVSSRIMDLLHVKRAALRRGLEYPFQDLLDWLQLAAVLGECVTVDAVLAFSSDLGPCNRAEVEDALLSVSTLTDQCESTARLYLTLKTVRPVLHDASCLTGYYFSTSLDSFIEDDEALVGTTLFQGTEIKHAMRAKLCEWLYETYAGTVVHRPVREETYFLGTALLDRFLAVYPVTRSTFLLCGCAAVLLASKNEEIYSPTLQRVVHDVQMTFSEGSLAEMERQIAMALNFSLGVPTISNIANAFLVEQDPPASPTQRSVLSYLLVALSIHTYHGQYRQALLASAAFHVSRAVCGVATGAASAQVQAAMPCVREAVFALSQSESRVFLLFSQKRLNEASLRVRDYYHANVCTPHVATGHA